MLLRIRAAQSGFRPLPIMDVVGKTEDDVRSSVLSTKPKLFSRAHIRVEFRAHEGKM